MDKTYWENSFATEMGDFLERKGFKRDPPNRGFFLELESLLKNTLKHELALNGEADKDSLMPFFIDTEPYLCGLRNIGKPDDANDPTMTWGTVFPPNSTYLPKPDKLMKNFPFSNDPQIHYTGELESIRNLPSNYLAEKTSYYLKNDPTGGSGASSSTSGGSSGVCKISQKNHPFVKFLNRKKFILTTTNPWQVNLSQIIRISGDLVIDKPLDILKGGIIICDGKITIEAPIRNYWFNHTPTSFDNFGFLTLISKKGIDINLPPTPTGKFGYPEMHAFLVCMTGGSGEIKLPPRKPVHIVGGVAVDKIDELVKYGGVIEWGFEPPEIADGKDLKEGGYFGLALGPRDIEVVVED